MPRKALKSNTMLKYQKTVSTLYSAIFQKKDGHMNQVRNHNYALCIWEHICKV